MADLYGSSSGGEGIAITADDMLKVIDQDPYLIPSGGEPTIVYMTGGGTGGESTPIQPVMSGAEVGAGNPLTDAFDALSSGIQALFGQAAGGVQPVPGQWSPMNPATWGIGTLALVGLGVFLLTTSHRRR